MDLKNFIEDFVKISKIDDAFGYYPFQLIAEDENGNISMGSLALGGDVMAVYLATKDFINKGIKKLFLGLDFPKIKDIENDFVAIYSIIDNKLGIILMPYDPFTGETFPMVEESPVIDLLKDQFRKFTGFKN